MSADNLRELEHEADGCREFDAAIVELALTGAATAEVEEHVGSCERCARALNGYRSTEQTLHATFLDVPAPAVRREPVVRRLTRSEVLRAAGLVAVVGVAAWLVVSTSRAPTNVASAPPIGSSAPSRDTTPALAVHPVAGADVELLAPHHARIDRGQSAFTIHDPRSVVDTPIGPLTCDTCEFSVRVDPVAMAPVAAGCVTISVVTGLVGGTLLFTGPSPFVQLSAGDTLTLAMPAPVPAPAPAQDPPPATPAPVSGSPKLVADQTTFDLGDVMQGEVRSHTFVVENRGDAPAKIGRIASNCGCTLAKIAIDGKDVPITVHTHFAAAAAGAAGSADPAEPPDASDPPEKGGKPDAGFVLEPGKKMEVRLEYNSTGQPPQALHKKLGIHSNDPANPRLLFELTGNVLAATEFSPKNLTFGQIVRGRSETRHAKLTLSEGVDFKIVGSMNTEGAFDLKLTPLPEAEGRGWDVALTLQPGVPTGVLTRTVVLKTDHPMIRLLQLPVFAEIVSAVRIVTDGKGLAKVIDFGVYPVGEPPTRSITIENADGAVPWTPTSIEFEPKNSDCVKAQIVTVEEGKRYRIDLVPQNVAAGKPLRTMLLIHANHPETNEIKVAVVGRPK